MNQNYIESISKQFRYYKQLGDQSFAQLTEDQLLFSANESSNSIANIVKHMWGNMMSRWTNFLTEDGEKNWRNREEEFESTIRTKSELITKWEAGWECLFSAIDSIDNTNLGQLIYIRNQGHTIMEAINRQVAHYAYHVGQIVYISKMIQQEEWHSLSIPKGQSKAYNDNKFSKEKKKAHFTDEYLKKQT